MRFQQTSAKRNSTRVLVCVALLLTFAPVAALAVTPDELYQRGLNRYQAGDYLSAAENLFAFLQEAPPNLTTDFRNQVNDALRFSEERVQSFTISSGGKADDASGKTTHATTPSRPKPGLPQGPSHTAVALKGSMKVMAPSAAAFETPAAKAAAPQAAASAEVEELKSEVMVLKGRLAKCEQSVKALRQPH